MGNSSVDRYKRICSMQIPPAVKKAGMDQLAKEGEKLASAMRQVEGVHTDTGRLQRSIRTERQDELLRFIVRAGGEPTTVHGYDYANAEEFGTAHMSANPFFWPTYRLLRKSRIRNVKAAMTRALKKEFHD